jgi:hypothetical protein
MGQCAERISAGDVEIVADEVFEDLWPEKSQHDTLILPKWFPTPDIFSKLE